MTLLAPVNALSDQDFKAFIARLKAASKGPDIAAALGLELKKGRAFCPACQTASSKTPDLVVKDGGFHCWKCGLKGDVVELVKVASGKSTSDAIAYLADRAGIARLPGSKKRTGHGSRTRKIVDPGQTSKAGSAAMAVSRPVPHSGRAVAPVADAVVDLYLAFLKTACRRLDGTPGAGYLAGRGIDVAVAHRSFVRYCDTPDKLWSLADKARIKSAGLSALFQYQKAKVPFLVFPYLRAGRPVYIKTRPLLSKADCERLDVPRFLNTGAEVPCLWNHDAIAAADQVMICEGEIDALSAVMLGYAGVGLPGSKAWKDAWLQDFVGKDVIIALDADKAGREGSALVAKSFIRAGLPVPRQMILPEGKDLNDVLKESMNSGKDE